MCRHWFRYALLLFFLGTPCSFAQPQDDPQVGVTIQLPVLGVSVDAAGTLKMNSFPDPTGKLLAARKAASKQSLPTNLQSKAAMRKVSLRRLEAAIAKKLEAGEEVDDVMRHLGGLVRVEYAFLFPNENDIVLAGPAEPWTSDLSGRSVGVYSGQPTVLLDDLLVALRTISKSQKPNKWLAISINPTADGIERLVKYQKQIPKRIPDHQRGLATVEFAKGLRDSLGLTNVAVYGLPRDTNLARVMIEADYRMKMIAVGLEAPPVQHRKMVTFVEALTGAPKDMQRWWLTPEYKCLKKAVDGTAIQLVGRGVALKTENILLGQNQPKRKKLKPSRAARAYANSFTKLYPEISKARPIFAQLRNAVDLLVVAAWLQQEAAFDKVGWDGRIVLDAQALPSRKLPEIHHAPSVANAVWKGNLLVLPVGGGVSIQPSIALNRENLIPDSKGEVADAKKALRLGDSFAWWWD